MEIMGLIVIVILLTLGMFFVVAFKASQPKKEVQRTYEDDQLSSNFIISFLKMNGGSNCNKYTMEDLIQDCAVDRRLGCGGTDTCTYIEGVMNSLANKTLMVWQKKFDFIVEMPTMDINVEHECSDDSEKNAAFQPISLYPHPGTVVVRLDICK